MSKADIVRALAAGQPASDWVVIPTSTVDGSITGQKALEGAGGLGCSWRAGPPSSEAGVAELIVSVLPGAAKEWTGALYGDGPTDQRRTFAGISAAAACGDPGCGATAAVGSSWVRVDLMTGPREGASPTSAFAKETDDEVFAGLTPAVESALRTVQGASAAQLRFPDHVPSGQQAPCTNYLKKASLAEALGVKSTSIDTSFQPDPKVDSLFAAAELRIGDSVCDLTDPRYTPAPELARVTVAPEQGWAVDDIAAHSAQRGDLRPVALQGLASGERALSSCGSSGNECSVVFTLGSDAIQVANTPRANQVAEAILAAAR
ncbi:hypothetical protein [Amnibacterium setariae]|uniref:Uncharacterized protein n=1 Tax=Amnibacterium setariae TaxID=2306585 RepID=A0A3A1TUC7_9MICO|nr:hypothetical protein [Amnibacterium setariae]RIX27832.1 hypothetical protein D1781_09875 [Amnibacterium setariae]